VQIGLIGGIGPAATDFYYKCLVAAFAKRQLALDMTIAHASMPDLRANLQSGNIEGQVAIYQGLANRLAAAGAQCVAVTSIAGHFCIEQFKPVSPLPVIDIIEATNAAVRKHGYKRIGILGTRIAMESRLYGGINTAELVAPVGSHLGAVNDAYMAMAGAGYVNEEQKKIFHRNARSLIENEGVEAIMLGGTDLALVYNQQTAEFPIVDCAAIHCDALLELATGK